MADVLSAAAGVPSAASTEPARRAARAEVDETSMTAAARRYTRRGELRQARKAEADRARLEAAEVRRQQMDGWMKWAEEQQLIKSSKGGGFAVS